MKKVITLLLATAGFAFAATSAPSENINPTTEASSNPFVKDASKVAVGKPAKTHQDEKTKHHDEKQKAEEKKSDSHQPAMQSTKDAKHNAMPVAKKSTHKVHTKASQKQVNKSVKADKKSLTKHHTKAKKNMKAGTKLVKKNPTMQPIPTDMKGELVKHPLENGGYYIKTKYGRVLFQEGNVTNKTLSDVVPW